MNFNSGKRKSTDLDLIRKLKNGDNKAWTIFYNHYKRSLKRVIQRVVKDNELADEILQMTYEKVWSRLDKFDSTKGAFFYVAFMHCMAPGNRLYACANF